MLTLLLTEQLLEQIKLAKQHRFDVKIATRSQSNSCFSALAKASSAFSSEVFESKSAH